MSRKLIALSLATLSAVALAGCGSSSSSTPAPTGPATSPSTSMTSSAASPSTAAAGCQAGQPVGPIGAHKEPTCALNDPATPTVLTRGCYPNGGSQKGSFYQVIYEQYALYGKPGGSWVRSSKPEQTDDALIKQIGC